MAAPRKDDTKAVIMDVTEELLLAQSIDDMSLAQIAKKAGISKGTLYYHYKTKEDILLDIADRYLEKQLNDFMVWIDNKEKDTSLHRVIKYIIEYNIIGSSTRIHLIYNACLENKDIREKIMERYNKFQQIISEKIAERAGSENADYLAWAVLLISDGLIIQKNIKNPKIDTEDFIKKTSEFVKLFSSKKI